MPIDRNAVRIFADGAEEARFRQLADQSPQLRRQISLAADMVQIHVTPVINRGAAGLTEHEIDAAILDFKTVALAAMDDCPTEQRLSPDDIFMWRIGFEAAAAEAKIAFLNTMEFCAKYEEGARLIAEALETQTEELELANALLATTLPPVAPDLIVLARQMGGEAAQATFETLTAPNARCSPRTLRRALPKMMRQCLNGLCLRLRKQDLRSPGEIVAYREGFEAERDRLLAGMAPASAPQEPKLLLSDDGE